MLRRKTGKIPSLPRDPRRAADPDDYGVKDSGPRKQKLRKRRQDLDPAKVLQADFDKRLCREEFLHAVNREAAGKSLSVALRVARDKQLCDETEPEQPLRAPQSRVEHSTS